MKWKKITARHLLRDGLPLCLLTDGKNYYMKLPMQSLDSFNSEEYNHFEPIYWIDLDDIVLPEDWEEQRNNLEKEKDEITFAYHKETFKKKRGEKIERNAIIDRILDEQT